MLIYGRVGQPSHRAVYLTYMQICTKNKRTAGHENPKKPAGGKTRGTCTPDQGNGATLGVLGYAST